jgi:hypothetical protein
MTGRTQVSTYVVPFFSIRLPASIVPPNVEHSLIWTWLPILHSSIVPEQVVTRLERDGLCGFTGTTSPPPSSSTLPSCLPALSEWGITMEKLVRSPKGTQAEDEMVKRAGREIHEFVRNRWVEQEWETAWFVNPPVSGFALLPLSRWLLFR